MLFFRNYFAARAAAKKRAAVKVALEMVRERLEEEVTFLRGIDLGSRAEFHSQDEGRKKKAHRRCLILADYLLQLRQLQLQQ
jgi:hypothetical protein